MYIGFNVERNIKIHHVTDAFHIQPACRHISGHQNIQLTIAQTLHGAFALRLRHIAIEWRYRIAARFQLGGKFFGTDLGARKDQHGVEGFHFQHAGQCIQLVQAADHPVTLTNIGGGGGLAADQDFRRVFQISLGNALDLRRHGRREQRHLTLRRHLLQNPFHVFEEAHVEHFVGFIQHHHADRAEIQRAALQVIHHPTGRADYHMRATTQAGQLRLVSLTAIDGQHMEARDVGSVFLERLGHLNGQLTGGRQHQRLHGSVVHINTRQHRQRERSGLAGAGLCLTQHIASCQQGGNGFSLNRRWIFVAHILQCLEQGFGQIQVAKSGGDGRFLSGHNNPNTVARPRNGKRGRLLPC